MTGPLTYHVTQARIEDLLRDAANRRRPQEVAERPRAALSEMLRSPRKRLGKPRRILGGPDPRAATR